ncbi:uncharacterized protein M421DRAFT_426994 [Didymella exigua CBS 183.55]|uniref:Uncharacterized protein n=1 Tax=Didymella exigua CBS 183.55 TaxID=1150837 RepID=A0A6A5R3W3_9PLEO|nr:uncharacterized protein M421DRAFT_426994 [Didymella exigua CBS 183.55]KAF1922352.1 hypothetical protein M421DRAFT_426994 [Didymella exigua CBS 183.55]
MLFSKLAVPFLSAVAVVPYSMAATVSYQEVINEGAKKSGKTPAQLDSQITTNGNKPKLVAALQPKLGWGKGVVCDLKCPGCADCATGAGQAAIAILAAFATAAVACATIVGCPEAIAAASVAAAAAGTSFCNSQHQPINCDFNCNWHHEICAGPATNGGAVPTPRV